jgi:hypothetical protein
MAVSQVTAQQCLLQIKWQGNNKTLSVQLNPIMVAPKQEMDNSKTSILPDNIFNKLYGLPYRVYL